MNHGNKPARDTEARCSGTVFWAVSQLSSWVILGVIQCGILACILGGRAYPGYVAIVVINVVVAGYFLLYATWYCFMMYGLGGGLPDRMPDDFH